MRTRTLISFDYAIKRLLRNKADHEVVEGLLTVLLERPVHIARVLESESNMEHETDKFNRVDVLVTDDSGELFIIELQFSYEIDYFQRMLYGASKALTERMSSGMQYGEVKKIYSVNIVYFDLGMGEDYVYHGTTRFFGLHNAAELQLSADQRTMFNKLTPSELFPEYYILKVNNFNDLAVNSLDEWVFYLKNGKVGVDFTAPGLKKAQEILNEAMLTDEERRDYDRAVDIRRSNKSSIDSAIYLGQLEGMSVGLEQGKAIGLEQGKAIGLEKGREEGEAKRHEDKLATARVLKASGITVEIIINATGLSKEEIDSL
jgi:predicted transposase/invertase (TIGR01784 family)